MRRDLADQRDVFSFYLAVISYANSTCEVENIRLKIYRLPYFIMPFLFLPTKMSKSELFSCLQKNDHVINYMYCKMF